MHSTMQCCVCVDIELKLSSQYFYSKMIYNKTIDFYDKVQIIIHSMNY